jgi:hypothetical protein
MPKNLKRFICTKLIYSCNGQIMCGTKMSVPYHMEQIISVSPFSPFHRKKIKPVAQPRVWYWYLEQAEGGENKERENNFPSPLKP